ncbi:unnamed protein product [Rodentolepis nana]|uniref:Neur_chan_memb domain-containing protein n=1 Tax=Rodentolepis nana TaxID=102285 RepID=A0A158QIF1_RODNA|nr:unnamed protein product [Rodentolepis nana]
MGFSSLIAGTYYCVNMFLVTLSTFLCLIVVNCHFRGDSHSELPRWAKLIFLVYGARIFFINSGPAKATSNTAAATSKSSNTGGGGGSGGFSRRAGDIPLAETTRTNKLTRSAVAADHSAYRSACHLPSNDQIGRCHMRDSYRGRCSCELSCHVSGCCQNLNENPAYYQPSSSLCPECHQQQPMQRHHNRRMVDTCCQQRSSHHDTTHRCQPSHASMSHAAQASCSCDDCNNSYREQEPPCLLPPSCYQRNAQPKSPFAEEDTTNQTCPACAAAASADDCVIPDTCYSDAHCTPKDPEAALADVWASAAHHRSGRSLRGNNPSTKTPRCPPFYNTTNLLTGGERNQAGYSTYCAQCQQCESEQYAAGMRGVNKPDARVLRRVATVTRDIGEIVRGIRYFQRKNEEKEKFQKIINEWRTVGGVLDRLFFICYLIAISITIIMYFPRPSSDE